MDKPHRHINRRAFLYAAGGAGVALPFLDGLPERSAFAGSSDPVFGFFICTANGVVQKDGTEPERFWPTETGPLTREGMLAFADERCTGLLADHAHQLLILRGVRYPQGNPTGCSHAQGLSQCLTGKPPTGANNQATSTGPSIDQVIAQALEGKQSLNLYSGLREGYINERLSFKAAGEVVAAEPNPYNIYQRLMSAGVFESDGAMGGASGALDQVALRKKSINDLVREQINSLRNKPQLSRSDRDRLDLHFQSIRDVEVAMQDMAAACSEANLDVTALEALQSGTAFKVDGSIEQVAKLHFDLVALSFACNQNRVAAIQIGDGTDGTHYVIDGRRTERFHHISHRIFGDGATGADMPEALDWHIAIDRIRMGTFKYLLDKWSQYEVPAGALLDNAFVYWTNCVAAGPSHSYRNLPVIVAGSGGGKLKQGQYIDSAGATNATLLSALMGVMGLEDTTFGGTPFQDMLA